MNEVSKQQLSALLDGELGADEARFLLRRIEADAELAQLWSRYQLMGDCLRGRAVMPVGSAFALRVMQQIEQDAAASAPQARPPRASRWLRYGLGGSIAASVAVAALVWLQPRPATPVSNLAEAPAAVSTSSAPIESVADTFDNRSIATAPVADFGHSLQSPITPLLNVQPAAALRSQGSMLAAPSIRDQQPVWMQAPVNRGTYQHEMFLLGTRAAYPPPGVMVVEGQAQRAQALPH